MTTNEHWALLDSGVWECGECHRLTTVTHFYRDRASGEMRHAINDDARRYRAAQCGWSFDYDYGGVQRCALQHGHRGDHDPRVHGYGKFASESRTHRSARPPASLSDNTRDT